MDIVAASALDAFPAGMVCLMFVLWAAGAVGYVVFLVAMWKIAKAHEMVAFHLGSIATSMQANRWREPGAPVNP